MLELAFNFGRNNKVAAVICNEEHVGTMSWKEYTEQIF